MPANHESSSRDEPLSVPAFRAFRILGVGKTKGHGLIQRGELESVKLGRSRPVTMRSIKALIHNDAA